MSNQAQHTPGPWHTDPSKSFYVFAHGSLAEQAGVTNGPFICNASTLDNARLIAAAPDLLEALETLVKLHHDWDKGRAYVHVSFYEKNKAAIAKAHAVIAKAKGR